MGRLCSLAFHCGLSPVVKHEGYGATFVNDELLHHHRPNGIVPGIQYLRLLSKGADEHSLIGIHSRMPIKIESLILCHLC